MDKLVGFNSKINNKKGFLLAEETLKIILGVIAIGFLAYLLFSIYNSNKTSEKLGLARESLNHLFSEIDNGRIQVEIYNPKGWWILSGGGNLCICQDKNYDSCISKGVCRENTNSFSLNQAIKIDNPPVVIDVNYDSKEIT